MFRFSPRISGTLWKASLSDLVVAAGRCRILRRPKDGRQRQLPLPVRNERGEGWGEGHPTADAQAGPRKNNPPLPSPLLPQREEREKPSALSSVVQAALSSARALNLRERCSKDGSRNHG